jgi:hypothetical protein
MLIELSKAKCKGLSLITYKNSSPLLAPVYSRLQHLPYYAFKKLIRFAVNMMITPLAVTQAFGFTLRRSLNREAEQNFHQSYFTERFC